MKKVYLSMLFAVMVTSLCVAYENDGPGYDPKAPKRVRLMSASDSFKPPESSDICFVATSGGDLGKEVWGPGGSISIPLRIDRYFGDKMKLIKSKALPETVTLKMVVWDVDDKSSYTPAEYDEIFVNGKAPKDKKALYGVNDGLHMDTFTIDTKYIELPENPGETAINTIRIDVATKGGEWVTRIDWVALEIPAAPPVILSHGINSCADQLKTLQQKIKDETGLPCEIFDYPNHGNNHISDIGALSSKISEMKGKNKWNVEHVNIVAHSMGGLRAREYAENANDVFKVLQIATPNRGSPFADGVVKWSKQVWAQTYESNEGLENVSKEVRDSIWACAEHGVNQVAEKVLKMNLRPWSDPAIECLQTSFMDTYNGKHRLNDKVEYGVVAGNVTENPRFPLFDGAVNIEVAVDRTNKDAIEVASLWAAAGASAKFRVEFDKCISDVVEKLGLESYNIGYVVSGYLAQNLGEIINDLYNDSDWVVPVSSAHHIVPKLAGSELKGDYKEVWHSGLIGDGVGRVVACLKPKLVEKKTEANNTRNLSTIKNNSRSIRKFTNTLTNASILEDDAEGVANNLQTGVAFSGKSASASFGIVQGHHAMVILEISTDDIKSTTLKLKAPSGKVYEDCARNVYMTNGMSNAIVMLANPEKGKWTLEWTSEFSNSADIGIWTLAAFEVDDGVVFSPKLINTSAAIGDSFALTVSPKVGDSVVTGTVKVVATAPNGTSAIYNATRDASGVFSAQIPALAEGNYTFAVMLDATSPSVFSRSSIISGVAHSGGAGFLQSHSAVVPDVDGNGLYDNLTVNFAVNATKAGTYRVLATLADTDGNEITDGWTSNIVCSAGTRTFPVAFDGRAIYEHGECAGYKVSSAKLLEVGEDYEAVVDERSDLFTTTSYTYRQFEHDLVAMKSGGSDSAVDVNGDGVYDRLDVTIPLYADDLAAGSYEWSASLIDADGFLLGTASGGVTFAYGQGGASISMSFGRDGIVATHKNGKYYVKNLIIWGNGRNLTIPGEYVTATYNIEDFGGELATVDLGFVLPLGWSDPLIISTNATGTAGQTFFEQGDPIYLNYAFANIANQAVVSNFVNRFTLSNGSDYSDSWIGYGLREGGRGWLGEGVAPEMLQNLPAGTYTLTCELDVDGQMPETDEFNNVADVTFTINESLRPNLKLSSASVSKTSLALSDSVVFHWRVENTGRTAAKKTKTAFQTWKYDASSDTWTLKKTENLDCVPLAAGGGREFTRTISGKTFGVGEFAIGVRADGNGSLMELDESDNLSFIFFTVSKDNAVRSSSGVDWQFKKLKSSEADSFFLSASSSLKKKTTTFKVGQRIYMRRAFWNATKKSVSGQVVSAYWLNGEKHTSTSSSSFISAKTILYNTDSSPDYLQNLPAGKYTFTAVLDSENNWTEKNEKNNVRRISFTVVDVPTIYGETAFTCALNESVSWPISSEGSMSVKGLPPGMKYSGGAIVGKATKTGTFTAKFTAKNGAGTRTKTVKIVVVNPGFDVSVNVRANGATGATFVAPGETVPMFIGVVQNITIASTPGKEGVAKSAASSVSVKGLPPGLKYSKGVISGVPSKTGTYTVKLAFKNALGWSKSFSMKMAVKSLPAWARGTFYGWTHEGGVAKHKVTVSVTSAGKISAKIGSQAFARNGWTIDKVYRYFYEAPMRVVRTTGTGKKKKTYTDILTLSLSPNMAWTEDQLIGGVYTFSGNVTLADALEAIEVLNDEGLQALVDDGVLPVPINVDTWICARRNSYGDDAEAKALAAELVALGTLSITDAEDVVWNLKVAANGVATITRTTGTGKNKKTISATAVVEWAGDGYAPYVVFFVSGRIINFDWHGYGRW